MRCPSCEKMVSYNTEETPEGEEPSLDGTSITMDVRRVLTCADCGEELKAADFSLEMELVIPDGADTPGVKQSCGPDVSDHEWDESRLEPSIEPTIETEGKGRGRKTFYGVTVSGSIACTECGIEATFEGFDRMQASHMEEC